MKQYFKTVSAGYDKKLLREQIEIQAGENAKIIIMQAEEGFIIDVYGQNEHYKTMAVWEDELEDYKENVKR